LEYTLLAQYAEGFRSIPFLLFEHDIFFQSLERRMVRMRRPGEFFITALEYLRMLRFELKAVRRMARVQVCSRDNAAVLLEYAPELKGRLDSETRAVIDVSQYAYQCGGREPDTVLFLGSFQHLPNREALEWFINDIWPKVLAERSQAKFIIVGAHPPADWRRLSAQRNVQFAGFVSDVREPLSRYSIFVCPILTGSGVRVKLLEAFATGIPVVSTQLGAEGLAEPSSAICEISNTAQGFADSILHLLGDTDYAAGLAARARETVVRDKDAGVQTVKLEQNYRDEIRRCRGTGAPRAIPVPVSQAEAGNARVEERL
jgi:glycosyltransferase involved in cell wall biosynthesis